MRIQHAHHGDTTTVSCTFGAILPPLNLCVNILCAHAIWFVGVLLDVALPRRTLMNNRHTT